MKQFVETPAGRMLVFALGLALAGGGAATLAGPAASVWLLALVFPVSIALSVLALGLAAEESLFYAVRAAVLLPPLLFLYVLLLGSMAGSAPIGWALLVTGGGALALGIRPRIDEPAMHSAAQQH